MGEYQRKLRARLKGPAGPSPKRGTETPSSAKPKRDFMRDRRMFAVVEGVVRVAEKGDGRFHREWLKDVDQDAFDRLIRGYYLEPELVAYRRHMEPVSMRGLGEHLPALKEALSLPDGTKVYSGARPAETGGDDLKGLNLLGDLSDLLEYMA